MQAVLQAQSERAKVDECASLLARLKTDVEEARGKSLEVWDSLKDDGKKQSQLSRFFKP